MALLTTGVGSAVMNWPRQVHMRKSSQDCRQSPRRSGALSFDFFCTVTAVTSKTDEGGVGVGKGWSHVTGSCDSRSGQKTSLKSLQQSLLR